MRKIQVKVVALLLLGGMAFHSCIGSFGLLNKYAQWQTSMTNNKYVNGIVGIILGSVAVPITSCIDLIVLNTIEFWSGSNPMASNVDKQQTIMGTDGRLYAVRTCEGGYELKSPKGEVSYFLHDAQTDTWSLQKDGQVLQLFRYNSDGTLTTLPGSEQSVTVMPTEAGIYQVQMAAGNGSYFSQR